MDSNRNNNISTSQKTSPKELTREEIVKWLDALAGKCQEECKGTDLFAHLLPMGECALCFLPFPRESSQHIYLECCRNKICRGCYSEETAILTKKHGGQYYERTRLCPFCRAPDTCFTFEEEEKLLEAQASRGDVTAHDILAENFLEDPALQMKGLYHLLQGIELGSSESCLMLSRLLKDGGCETIKPAPKKADIFRLTAAVRGDIGARHECGTVSYDRGNHELGIQHWKVAAEAGMQPSLDALKYIYSNDRPGKEFISKEDMASIDRACHQAQKEVWSEQREKHRKGEDVWKC